MAEASARRNGEEMHAMDSSAAQRRLRAISGHLRPAGDRDRSPQLGAKATAGEFASGQGYGVVLPEKLQNGKWNVYSPEHPDIGTLHDNFEYAVETFRDYMYLGTRVRIDGTVGEYKWMTYGEAGASRSAIGSGLIYHGIPKGACVGLYFINRPEWIIVDHACSAYSYISVPLYDTLGPNAVQYIVNHAAVRVIFCVPQTLSILLSFLSQIPCVRLVVVVGGIDESIPSVPSTTGVEIIAYSKLHNQGHSNLQPFCPPKPEDVATICYTSGTTGTPKGVLLAHENLIANVAGASLTTKFYPSDIYISYLPLAHIYERGYQISLAHFGAAVGFYQGDNLKLMDDIATLRPTIFSSVPRLFNRIYAGIINAVKTSGGVRERLFNAAYNAKMQALANGKNPNPMWDRLVFNKIKQKLGGKVRIMTSEIKLVDVPEMSYTSDDKPYARGEICVRGPIVFQGYYKDDVQTKEVIDEDGWLHTGDIGLWLPGGRLKIIDRKKNIFKLAQGEYIAPEKIENVYAKCSFISQCFVYGDSLNSCLVAIVSVEQDILKAWAASEGIKYNDPRELCAEPRAKAAVLAEMDAVGKLARLRGFEFAKAVTLTLEPFTVENGLLTPTFKIKRAQAKAYFAKTIADMYAELSTSDPSPNKPS